MKSKFLIYIVFLMTACSQSQNPEHICKDCKTFDLAKVTYQEDIQELTAKAEIFKIAIVNESNQEKRVEEVTDSDKVKLYKYRFLDEEGLFEENPISYDNKFFFDGLTVLTDAEDNIQAFSTTTFYDGKMEDIEKFIVYMKKKYSNFHFEEHTLRGGMPLYRWTSDDEIIQIVSDKEEGTEIRFDENGKETEVSSTHISLTIYGKSFIENNIKEWVENNSEFLIYEEQSYE